MLKALLWNVDGTLAETEHDGHLVAFNPAVAQPGLRWCWSERRYGELLAITGGHERVALAERLHALKNACCARTVAEGLIPLRPGVRELWGDCTQAGGAMAIVTTTSRANVVARLDKQPGSGWPAPFAAVVCGAEVARKRPDLQADPCALDALRPRRADTLAIEDAPAGVAAASAAGVPVVVTHSRHFRAGPISPAVAVGPSLGHAQGGLAARAGSAGRTDFSQLRNRHTAARLRL